MLAGSLDQRPNMGEADSEEVDGVIEEARREAEIFGEGLWEKLAEAGVVGSREEFEELDSEDREEFAKAYLAFKGRDPSSSGLEPVWTEGLHRMAEHARAQGFGGVVFMLDEMLLWLAEKTGTQFKQEIHDLNLIVDHPTRRREVPIFVFVARQRNIRDFFPELTAEDDIHEHLDHHAERFELTELQDVELRHIVKGRILRPKDPERLASEIESLVEAHRNLLPALLQDADVSYLKDVYPFHPALIETLVDVSAAMQRERSALRLLYELLVVHHRDLEVGKFLPVGSAFDAIFPPEGVEASKNEAKFKEIHNQYHHQLVPAMDKLRDEGELDDGKRRMLDQLVKTVLLSEVSLRLKGHALTARRLVGLNVVDVAGATDRLKISQALGALRSLSRRVPALQVSGEKAEAVVRYTLSTVSLSEFLSQSKAKVGKYGAAWLRLLLETLRPMLDLEGKKGLEGWNLPQECSLPFEWRRTKRLGVVRLCNVRTTGYDDFVAPAKAFRILVGYPWDEGHSVDEDRLRSANARKQNRRQYTVCWLPRHLEKQEEELVGELWAVRYLLSEKGQDELLRDLGHQDRQTILKDAETHRRTLRGEFEKMLARVYVDQGEIVTLHDGIDTQIPHKDNLGKNLERFASVLLDRRFPGHPNFGARPAKKDLELVRAWLLRASDAGTSASTEFDVETGKALRYFGEPLELVNLGQSRGMLRLDSRYYRAMEKKVDGKEQVEWSEVRDELETSFGLDESVIDVLLSLLCSRGYRPLRAPTQEVVEVGIGTTKKEKTLLLERAKLLEPATWGRARDLGEELLGEAKPSSYRGLGEQDGFARRLHERGRACRHVLSDLHEGLVGLGVAPEAKRLAELKEALQRLEPLESERTDSYTTLHDFLDRWDDDVLSRLRVVVSRAEKTSKALGELDVQDRTSLETGRSHAEHGAAVAAHLEKLSGMLSSSEHGDALTSEKVQGWNAQAHELVQELIKSKVDPLPPPPPPPPPPPGLRRVFVEEPVDLSSDGAVGEFLDRLGGELRKEPRETVLVDVTLRREGSG